MGSREQTPEEKQKSKEEVDIAMQSVTTGTTTLKEATKDMDSYSKKQTVTKRIKELKIEGMKMTEGGDQISYKAPDKASNIKKLKALRGGSLNDDFKNHIDDLLDVYK